MLISGLGAAGCGEQATGGSGGSGSGGAAPACPAPAIADDELGCIAVGIESCPDGFEPTADAGCLPVLPAEPCGPGTMALPGETTCRQIMPCGEGPWGDVPIEPGPTAPGVVYVDQAYAGVDPPDGSAEHPFTTISEALAAVGYGGQIVIAAGHYLERLHVDAKSIRIWGRCPSLVRITGDNASIEGSIRFIGATAGQELHGVRVDGPGFGIIMTNVVDVLLDRLWVTETAASGIVVDDTLGPASLRVVDSLVEALPDAGILVGGAELSVERSEVRNIHAGAMGVGVGIGGRPAMGLPTWSVAGSLVHRTVGLGIGGFATELSVTTSAVLDVAPIAANDLDGHGIALTSTTDAQGPLSLLSVSRTTVARTHDAGIATSGVAAHLDEVTVVDIFPELANSLGGVGIALQSSPEGAAPMLVERSSVADTPGFGISVADVDATIDRCVLRRAQPLHSEPVFGDGAIVVGFERRPSLALSWSRSGHNTRAGVSAFAADLTVLGSHFECNAFDLANEATDLGEATTTDAGDNHCGCEGVETACKAISQNLAPPAPP